MTGFKGGVFSEAAAPFALPQNVESKLSSNNIQASFHSTPVLFVKLSSQSSK